ncbi:MAG: site-specific DNA-methyltransferase [Prevotella sp.]|nr:site-specific DNA-methyltransferase [Prevotella sp.]
MVHPKHIDKQTADGTAQNLEALYQLFPSCFTESADAEGNVKQAINWEKLRELLGDNVADGEPEVYDFTWVGKRAAQHEAMKPCRKTLRPCPEESVNWDTTQNLYIEGDNLEVLKLLQNSYMGKVKMIYIDPPYNTGNDFVYHDDFHRTQREEDEAAGVINEDGERMVKNTESNGKFHSDWCSMIYSRLMVARSLLTENGVVFVSIDDNELENLIKIGSEVFGEFNYIGPIIVKSNPRGSMSTAEIANLHEYILIFSKSRESCSIIGDKLSTDMESEYKYEDENGKYRLLGLRMRGGFWRRTDRPKLYFPIYVNPKTGLISIVETEEYSELALPIQPSTNIDGTWRWSSEKILKDGNLLIAKQVSRDGLKVWDIFQKDYLNRESGRRTKTKSIWDGGEVNYQNGTDTIKDLLGNSGIFDYSKPYTMLCHLMNIIEFGNEDCILDFFSGSATTAHAVMHQNAEDGGNRKFIMVQLPEETDEKSEAYKAGYKNICEIGKERIRRAGKKIKEDSPLTTQELDIGFRVFKCDDSNYKDVAFAPKDYSQESLDLFVDNIKEDRSDLDLLFDCMLRWGVTLDLPMTKTKVAGCTIHNVNEGALVACFDGIVTEAVIDAIAEMYPAKVVFRDSSFEEAAQKMNIFELFKQKCGWDEQEVRNNVRVI